MNNPLTPNRIDLPLRLLGWSLLALLPFYAWVVIGAPTDSIQGPMQKILYVHPPLAYGAYLGFVATAIAGHSSCGKARSDTISSPSPARKSAPCSAR